MNDITVIIPLNIFDQDIAKYFENAVDSVYQCRNFYDGILKIMVILPQTLLAEVRNYSTKYLGNNNIEFSIVANDGDTDFCSQINNAAKIVDTKYFSILEVDDTYMPKWFKDAKDYYYTHEDVSVFLPVNVQTDEGETQWQFANEIAWTSSFSNEIGFIDFDCLENYSAFNLTGGIFNTDDFNTIGGLKPSIEIAFNYEFLLRLTSRTLKAYVVPKEGYKHIVNRTGSLTDYYMKTIPNEDIHRWFELAKREYLYTEDRGKGIIKGKAEDIK